jgi:hypothetical protein
MIIIEIIKFKKNIRGSEPVCIQIFSKKNDLKQKTLRAHACREDFPVLPIRINSRLHSKTAEVRALLNGGAK